MRTGSPKLIPVSVKGMAYMACRFAKYVFTYRALFFGWRPSPANCGIMSTLLMQFISSRSPLDCHTEGAEAYVAYQYVDDGTPVEPWLGLRPWKSAPLWEYGLTRCLGGPAAHLGKKQLEGNAGTCFNLWGVTVSTVSNTFTLHRERSKG